MGRVVTLLFSSSSPCRLLALALFCRIFLSVMEHNVHHADYSLNFSLLTGWSNGLFNFVSGAILHPRNTNWFWILLVWILAVPGYLNWHTSMRRGGVSREGADHTYNAVAQEATGVDLEMAPAQKVVDDELEGVFQIDDDDEEEEGTTSEDRL